MGQSFKALDIMDTSGLWSVSLHFKGLSVDILVKPFTGIRTSQKFLFDLCIVGFCTRQGP